MKFFSGMFVDDLQKNCACEISCYMVLVKLYPMNIICCVVELIVHQVKEAVGLKLDVV